MLLSSRSFYKTLGTESCLTPNEMYRWPNFTAGRLEYRTWRMRPHTTYNLVNAHTTDVHSSVTS